MENRNQTEPHHTNRWKFILSLGFFAGLIWGAVKIVFYYLGFTKVIPGFLAEPFYTHKFLNSWNGHLVGWFYFIVFSLLASVLYMIFFSKVKGPWLGIGYGLFWWSFLYLFFGPLNGMMKRIDKLDWNSIISDICLFLLWGIFIGYTVSMEFTDESQREPLSNFKTSK